MSPRQSAVKLANTATPGEIQQYVPSIQIVKDKSYYFCVKTAEGMDQVLKDQIWLIFEKNMRNIYESTNVFEWNPTQKREEMFHELARFLLIFQESSSETHGFSDLLGYAIFRFEREDKRNVVYVYELQTAEISRRLGLGRALMHNLNTIGGCFNMSAIMLTHFKANGSTRKFYDSMGFKLDRISPDFEDDDEWVEEGGSDSASDYSILSLRIVASS